MSSVIQSEGAILGREPVPGWLYCTLLDFKQNPSGETARIFIDAARKYRAHSWTDVMTEPVRALLDPSGIDTRPERDDASLIACAKSLARWVDKALEARRLYLVGWKQAMAEGANTR